jgi:proline iminopeptidase
VRRLDDPYFAVQPARADGHLERPGGHRIYWQDSGRADGPAIVLLHGGPGGASGDGYRRALDSSALRIVQFDQRGCGRSQPAGTLSDNTLQHTLGDMEALRSHLGIERWIVAGGSWGSTVAVAYSEAYPERALGLVSVGTWLCRRKDIDWWFHGVRTLFPELWEAFAAPIPPAERADLRRAYCTRILERGDEEAARRLYLYEEGFMHFDVPLTPPDPQRGTAYGRIFAHYAAHDFFLSDNQLVANAPRIALLPALLITGRYDACTTPDNAYDLARVLPRAELRIVAGAGHYPTEHALAVACAQARPAILQMAERQ